MRRFVGLVALGAVAAGCMGGGSQHGTLSANDALAQARKDGFVKPERDTQPASWLCDRKSARMGPTTPSGNFANFVRPSYVLRFEDARVPATADNTARIGLMVIVFPDASLARRCAEAGMYQAMHIPVHRSATAARGPYRRYKVIDSTTVEVAIHAPGAPGFEFPVREDLE